MTARPHLSASRKVFNPILSDDSVMEVSGAPSDVFYTPAAQRIERHRELITAAAAGLFLLTAWVLSLTGGPPPLRQWFTLLAFVVAGVPALRSVWGSLRELRIDIDTLMLLGAGLAAIIGSPFEGALLLFLFALSGGLEAFALRRTHGAIDSLRDLAPREATLMEGDTSRRVSLREVSVGALVLVRPGEKVPLDGIVVEGASTVDESAMTGESIPSDRTVDDQVFAGTQNLDGRLVVKVTKLAADTTLARIIALVTDARHQPTRAQRMIDRIGPPYSIGVIVASILVGLIGTFVFGLEAREAVRRSIALLIVASPCALIIATPVAYLSAIAAAARNGVLIKGGVHLEVIAKAKSFVFDKTGTLTTGRIKLTDIQPPEAMDEAEALKFAGAIEASSNHPLAGAVDEALSRRGLSPYPISEYTSTPGAGASGMSDGHEVWIGRPEHAAGQLSDGQEAALLDRAESLRREGKTVSALLIDRRAGLLAFEDTLRDGARTCVDRLRSAGIERLEMFTGDHSIVAEKVSQRLGLDGFQAEMHPEDKLVSLQSLRKKSGTLVMVGDGINDAPALAAADTGIAIGGMGAEVALDAADVVLMKDRIESVAWLHHHARRTASVVKQNLLLAIGVISLLSVFAVLGHIPLPLAVVGHEGSTVVVALNGLRLLRNRSE